MLVKFDYTGQIPAVENKTSYRVREFGGTQPTSRQNELDISDVVMDNEGYQGQGMTAEEVMLKAQALNQDAEQDYMVLMSNSVSEEDYAKLMEEGFDPGSMEPEEIITILDKIKATMAEAGEVIVGYNDSLDAELLKEITGSVAHADCIIKSLRDAGVTVSKETVKKVSETIENGLTVAEVTDAMCEYLLENHLEPSVQNLYLAKFCAGTASKKKSILSSVEIDRYGRNGYGDINRERYKGNKESSVVENSWKQVEEQAQKIIKQSGMVVNRENTELARWLFEHGQPIDCENLNGLSILKSLSLPSSAEQLAVSGALSIHDYGTTQKAGFYPEGSLTDRAVLVKEELNLVTDEGIETVVREQQPFTIKNLYDCSMRRVYETVQVDFGRLAGDADRTTQTNSDTSTASGSAKEGMQDIAEMSVLTETAANIGQMAGQAKDDLYMKPNLQKAKLLVEETRLMMSISANVSLLRRGVPIDTTELSKLVEQFRKESIEENKCLYGSQEGAAIYTETMEKAAEINQSPAVVVGSSKLMSGMTFLELHEMCLVQKKAYSDLGTEYEKLMTAPRSDLGDNIRKAFSTMDSLLQSVGIEDTPENRRAVRIISYCRMELNPDKVKEVVQKDAFVTGIMDKMTPASVISLIKAGKNPLGMTLEELEQELRIEEDRPEKQAEKFSRFLYDMDRHGEITEKERKAYIGIYRMLRQIEKTDGAAVGHLMNQGNEINFRNLLKAVQSIRDTGRTTKISDEYGFLQDLITKGERIETQILEGFTGSGNEKHTGYSQKTVDYATHWDSLAENSADQGDSIPEKEAQSMQSSSSKQYRDMVQEKIAEYRDAAAVGDEIFKTLKAYEIPVTMDHLIAMKELRNKGFLLYDKVENRISKKELSSLYEAFETEETADKATDSFYKNTAEELENGWLTESEGYLDVRAAGLVCKQLSLASSLIQQKEYYVPIETPSGLTCMNIKVIHTGEKATAKMIMKDHLGTIVAARLGTDKGFNESDSIVGYVTYCSEGNTSDIADRIKEVRKELTERLSRRKIHGENISFFESRDLSQDSFMQVPFYQNEKQNRENIREAGVLYGNRQKEAKMNQADKNTDTNADTKVLYATIKELLISFSHVTKQ